MRKYALRRFGPGDYVCPADDLTRFWRFHRYIEDGTLERGDGTVVVGTFWEAYSTEMPTDDQLMRAIVDDETLWTSLPWRTEATLCKTRRDAVAYMESTSKVAPR